MADDDNNNENIFKASCCNQEQSTFFFLYIGYLTLVFLTWGTIVVKPMRLLTTFVHEMSHALLCWCTGGNVHALEVYENSGGVTKYSGGCRCLIIPAGYLGEAFWGMIFTILSGGRKTATFASTGLCIALIVALFYSPNRCMVYLNIFYAIVTMLCIFVEWFLYTPFLTYVVLLYGVFFSTYSIGDIWQHLIIRTVQGSDSYALYEESRRSPCCYPKCVGIQWLILAILMQLFGLWFALVLLSEECRNRGWGQCVFSDVTFDFFDDLAEQIKMRWDKVIH